MKLKLHIGQHNLALRLFVQPDHLSNETPQTKKASRHGSLKGTKTMEQYTISRRKKKSSSRSPSFGRQTQPTLGFALDTKKMRGIPIADVNEDLIGAIISQSASARRVVVDLSQIARWPDKPRWLILQMLKEMGSRVCVCVNQAMYTDIFRAVLATLAGPSDLNAHRSSLRAAIEAAALFHTDIADTAAGLIHSRLKELGVQPERQQSIVKKIWQLAGRGSDDNCGARDPHVLARLFVQSQRSESGLTEQEGPEQISLIYHRSEYYAWRGSVWERLPDDALQARLTAFLQGNTGQEKVTSKLLHDVLANLKGVTLFDDWKVDAPFYIESWNPPVAVRKPWMACQNGIVDLGAEPNQVELMPCDMRFFSTTVLPLGFDPLACCPRWEEFLNQVLRVRDSHDRRQRILQEFFGYSLLADTRFEKMIVLVGVAGAGKSTIMRVWESMLGSNSVAHIPFDQLSQEFRLCDLRGKAANFTSDLDHLGRAREGLLKQLISGEPITVNRKHKSTIELRSHAKLVVGCNELPTISDTSNGIWRRLICIPFYDAIPTDQINHRLAQELIEELPGILNWALIGLARLLDQQQFTHCRHCQAVMNEHRTNSDTVAEFVSECCLRNPLFDVHSQRLFEVYRFFCDERNRKPVMETEFGKRMKRLGYVKGRATPLQDVERPRIYEGVALNGAGRDWLNRCVSLRRTGWTELSYDASDKCSPVLPSRRAVPRTR